MTSRSINALFLAIAVMPLVAWAATSQDLASEDARAISVEQGPSCNCPDGYLPIDGACCPACYFVDPPCLLPCFVCEECGLTGDPCDYSRGLTCCGGSQLCCPAGAQSTCSDFACAE